MHRQYQRSYSLMMSCVFTAPIVEAFKHYAAKCRSEIDAGNEQQPFANHERMMATLIEIFVRADEEAPYPMREKRSRGSYRKLRTLLRTRARVRPRGFRLGPKSGFFNLRPGFVSIERFCLPSLDYIERQIDVPLVERRRSRLFQDKASRWLPRSAGGLLGKRDYGEADPPVYRKRGPFKHRTTAKFDPNSYNWQRRY